MRLRPKLIVFDVNETLLDLAPLKTKVNKALGNDCSFDLWFSSLLHYSLVETITENYTDFSAIAKASFQMVAKKFKKNLPDGEVRSILGTIKKLPPHSDIIPALTRLQKAGFTLVALTNGNQEVALEQMAYAEIDDFFTNIFSVEKVGLYKPNSKTYAYILRHMNISSPDEALMVAAHGWDIVGAQRAGLHTAFIEREGKVEYPLGEPADFSALTILEITEKLIRLQA